MVKEREDGGDEGGGEGGVGRERGKLKGKTIKVRRSASLGVPSGALSQFSTKVRD